jgi:hypothetical protein
MKRSRHAIACWLLVAAIAAEFGSQCSAIAAMSAAGTAGSAGGRSDRAGYESAMRGSDIALYSCATLLIAGWCLAGTGLLVWLWSMLKGEPKLPGVPLMLLLVFLAMNFLVL